MRTESIIFKATFIPKTNLTYKGTNTPVAPTGEFNVPNEYTVTYPATEKEVKMGLAEKVGEQVTRIARYYLGCTTFWKDEQMSVGGVDPHPEFKEADAIWFRKHILPLDKKGAKILAGYLSIIPPCLESPHIGERVIMYSILDTDKEDDAALKMIKDLEKLFASIDKLAKNPELLRKAADVLGIDPNKSNSGIVLEMRKKAEQKDANGNLTGYARVETVLSSFEDNMNVTIDEAIQLGIILEQEMGYSFPTGEPLKRFRAIEKSVKKNRERLCEYLKTTDGSVQYGLIQKQINDAKVNSLVEA